MAITQVYTAVPNDVITAARWNNEFGNIYNNGTQLAFPATTAVSFNGQTITLDVSGVTTISSTAAVAFSLTPGAKAGTPGTGANSGNNINIAASTFTDTNTANSGTAAEFSSVSIQQPTLAATNTNVVTTDAATLYIRNAPAAGTNETITNAWAIWVDNGNVRFDGNLTVNGNVSVAGTVTGSTLFGKPIGGLTYANAAGDATNDITIAVGEASSDDATLSSRQLLTLASALTKQLDATWAVGTNAGGLDTGAVGNSSYYIWLIKRPDTGVVDALFSLSSTAPTMPTSYTLKRLIGWFKRTGGTNVAFLTYEVSGGGLEFLWSVPTLDIDLSNTVNTTRRTDALNVPLNFSVEAHVNAFMLDAAALEVWISCPDQADTAPSTSAAPLTNLRNNSAGAGRSSQLKIRTSASGLISSDATGTVDEFRVATIGWVWSRR